MSAGRVCCVVAYATPAQQHLWTVELPPEATVGCAIEAARRQAGEVSVPWDDAPVGIFGQPCSRSTAVHPGDRIELYRPLRRDPRERRRARLDRG